MKTHTFFRLWLLGTILLLPVMTYAQNPILRSTTTAAPGLTGVTTSLFTQNGNFMGLGTANPTQRLTITGHSQQIGGGGAQVNIAPTIRMEYISLSSGNVYWHLVGGDQFEISNPGTSVRPLRIDPSGRVDFLDKVQANVQGITGNHRLGFDLSDPNARKIFWTSWAANTNNYNMPLEFTFDAIGTGTTDVTLLRLLPTGQVIMPGGQVRIGDKNTVYENYTGTPINSNNNFRLTVDGGVAAHSYVATIQNWADWVFYEPWKNPTLAEEKASIESQCTLVGVPSEEDVKHGANLAETDAILLSKVEQNYLHDIQQQEMIEMLIEKIKLLEAEIEALKSGN